MLGAAEEEHLRTALAWLNMTESDMGFRKDYGEPLLVLEGNRALLSEPFLLPALADRVFACAESADPEQAWHLAGELLEVPAEAMSDAVENAAAGTHGDQAMPWDALDPVLAAAVTGFFREAEKAASLLQRAWRDVTPGERRYLATSCLAGTFNAEDHEAVRAALLGAGAEPEDVARAIEEGQAIDPKPAATNFLAIAGRISLPHLLAAGQVLQRAAVRLRADAGAAGAWPERPQHFLTDLGAIDIGSPGPDVFTNAALLVLDPGGDDQYTHGAASANGLRDDGLSVVIDLGGDDRYAGEGMVGPGGALLGAAVILEAAGDDLYRAEYTGEGSALFGIGWLEDAGGDDAYRAHAHAQGAAGWGVAYLRDARGNDDYDVGFSGQGFAGVMGVGLLFDDGGNDRYFAGGRERDHERHDDRYISLAQGFAIGMRPYAGGGVAALVDLAGNDVYEADIFGQGAGYWYAAGLLLDAAGNDRYSAYQYGQGSGIHLSAGLLADGGGSDFYTGYVLTQGNAHDYAVGMLFEQGGDDTYTADHHAQGRAMNNALAVLVDAGGDDAYFARQPDKCQGIGNDGDKREYGSLALLLDLAGSDRYSCGAEDGARLLRPDFGIVYDVTEE